MREHRNRILPLEQRSSAPVGLRIVGAHVLPVNNLVHRPRPYAKRHSSGRVRLQRKVEGMKSPSCSRTRGVMSDDSSMASVVRSRKPLTSMPLIGSPSRSNIAVTTHQSGIFFLVLDAWRRVGTNETLARLCHSCPSNVKGSGAVSFQFGYRKVITPFSSGMTENSATISSSSSEKIVLSAGSSST